MVSVDIKHHVYLLSSTRTVVAARSVRGCIPRGTRWVRLGHFVHWLPHPVLTHCLLHGQLHERFEVVPSASLGDWRWHWHGGTYTVMTQSVTRTDVWIEIRVAGTHLASAHVNCQNFQSLPMPEQRLYFTSDIIIISWGDVTDFEFTKQLSPPASTFLLSLPKLQALVYDILPLEEGAGKRCSECGSYPVSVPSIQLTWRKTIGEKQQWLESG